MSQEATQMATLLSALTQPNTEAIRSAEAELKPILKDPRSVPALMEILSATGDAQVCDHSFFSLKALFLFWTNML